MEEVTPPIEPTAEDPAKLPSFYVIAAEYFAMQGDTSVRDALHEFLQLIDPEGTAQEYVEDIHYFMDEYKRRNPVVTPEMAEEIFEQALKELENGQ